MDVAHRDRGRLWEQIDGHVRGRIEEGVDSACLELLVRSRRERGLPMPESGSAADRAEFDAIVRGLLQALRTGMLAGLDAAATAAVGARDGVEAQLRLAKLLPDYWDRFDRIRADFDQRYRPRETPR